ncbi:MAG: NAD(P)H:quinone oxidoreductase [Gammaproteobacteria bacterium]|nr:NAD(P)H:quinone oxidoreductase [Gammaproteobacteria bacterium]
MGNILILFDSRHGSTRNLAYALARGVEQSGLTAQIRCVPPVSNNMTQHADSSQPLDGPPYATIEELRQCSGLILGSPTRFGNMSANLQYFLEQTSADWLRGSLAGKPAAVFTSSSSLHGGQESTLLSMMLPLLHHGMVLVGLPYTEALLSSTRSGGSPYGASHVAFEHNTQLTDEEQRLARALGERVARIAQQLTSTIK